MPVTWKFREAILMLRVCGVVTNRRSSPRSLRRSPMRSHRPACGCSGTLGRPRAPLTAEDVEWRCQLVSSLGERGVLSRAALLVRPEQQVFLELGRLELWKALQPVEGAAFSDEAEALAWLDR